MVVDHRITPGYPAAMGMRLKGRFRGAGLFCR